MLNTQYICYEMLDEDIFTAQKAYSCWESSKHETPVDFISRKRSVELSLLLNEVVENELTKIEQNILHMFYFEKLSVTDIAKELCLNRSTVSRRIDIINEKIFCSLKYAIKFKYDQIDDYIFPLALREAFSYCALQKSEPNCIGGRLLRLRKLARITCNELSHCTNISENRLLNIEVGHECMTAQEAVCLAAFFNVSTDYILTGKQNNKNTEDTYV
ncbi:MAG: sigma factor-like helix-turn-helix DNA-binding protein [Oscillospiraceae bacterium]